MTVVWALLETVAAVSGVTMVIALFVAGVAIQLCDDIADIVTNILWARRARHSSQLVTPTNANTPVRVTPTPVAARAAAAVKVGQRADSCSATSVLDKRRVA